MSDDTSADHWEDVREPANPLPLPQKWYKKQCNGDWEHSYGISIDTLDNPGWRVKVNLVGTSLQGKAFQSIEENTGPNAHANADRWLRCWIESDSWNGAGDPTRLNEILLAFLDWAAVADPMWPVTARE